VGVEHHWFDGGVAFMTLHMWDAQSGKEIYEFGNKDLSMQTARFLPGNKYMVATGYSNWGLYLWDIDTKKIVRQIDDKTQYLNFDITDDGKTVVLIKDNRVILWDFVAGKEIRQFC
jgi:WD40 repeat protein